MWNDLEIQKLFLENIPLIDVRAPIEFNRSPIPNSVNLPLINDEERREIGTCYKSLGQAAAINLGHQLVNGMIKDLRVQAWQNYIKINPNAQIFCFRGGLRSQISCEWLKEVGISKTPIKGGYKRLRHFLLSWLEDVSAPLPQIYRLTGSTGSGKTLVINKVKNSIDLEGLAKHRGSAFGSIGEQPSQIGFENELALQLFKNRCGKILMENESNSIGKITIPKIFFERFRESYLIELVVSEEERIKNIFNQYVINSTQDFFINGLFRIRSRLGGSNYKILKEEIVRAFAKEMTLESHSSWISILTQKYYDPLYQKDLDRQKSKIIFRGNESQIFEFFSQL